MNFGDRSMRALRMVTTLWAAAMLAVVPQVALAQEGAPLAEAPAQAAEADVVVTETNGLDELIRAAGSGMDQRPADFVRR